MVKLYLDYVADEGSAAGWACPLGLVTSGLVAYAALPGSTVVPVTSDSAKGISTQQTSLTTLKDENSASALIVSAALGALAGWNIRTGECLPSFFPPSTFLGGGLLQSNTLTKLVTALAISPAPSVVPGTSSQYAVGFSDGSISLVDGSVGVLTNFKGHKSAITTLAYNQDGSLLASGSADTDIIVWDVIRESGLCRLKGHKNAITRVHFMQSSNSTSSNDAGQENDTPESALFLCSASKDALVKVWDVGMAFCVETIPFHRGEVWDIAVCPQDPTLFVTAAQDGVLRVWSVDFHILASKLSAKGQLQSGVRALGSLERAGPVSDKITALCWKGPFLGALCGDAGRNIEFYRIRSEEECAKKLARKAKKVKKLAASKPSVIALDAPLLTTLEIHEKIPKLGIFRSKHRVKSFDLAIKKGGFTILTGLSTNSIEHHMFTTDNDESKQTEEDPVSLLSRIDLPGHSADIRTLALDGANGKLLSGSHESIKIWDLTTKACIGTMPSGYALCSLFLPGNKIVAIGTKEGTIDLFDIDSCAQIFTVNAHSGPVWSLILHPNSSGLISGSADKDVKFWDFLLTGNRLSIQHTKTLRLADDVLCVKASFDGKFLAVALLDCTVKVFYLDSLKFYLSLYGHKLPVVDMDITSDSAMIATCSSDKSIKLWGLDFGDCHRSLLAHEDSVMKVSFVFGTHYLWSGGKDGILKQWDCDKFEEILKLTGHTGAIWSLAVAKYGNFIVTGSQDRSIRIWRKTEDQFALEEAREKRLEEQMDQNLTPDARYEDAGIGSLAEDAEFPVAADISTPSTSTLLPTIESMKAGERILEVLDVWKFEKTRVSLDASQPPHPLLLASAGGKGGDLSAEEFVYKSIVSIPAAQLETALMTLPFSHVMYLLEVIVVWVEKGWNMPLTCRILFHLLKSHFMQITTTRACKSLLMSIPLKARLQGMKDQIGFNLAGLQFASRELAAEADALDFVGGE